MALPVEVIEGAYLRDLLHQPEAVRNTEAALRQRGIHELDRHSNATFVLTGMGSSLHALHPLCTRLNRAGRRAAMIETGELLRYHPNSLRGSVLVVVSQSGQSAEIIRLVKRRRADCFLVAVTNSPDSPLARKADTVVLMAAGEESTVSCKTYVATLAALAWLGDVLCGNATSRGLTLMKRVSGEMEAYLGGWKDHVRYLAGRFRGIEHLFLAARGDSLAAALTGGLIIKEAAHFHAEGMSAPQFRHGPFEMLSPRVLVLVFSGEKETRDLNLRLASDIRKAGAQSEMIGEEASTSVFRLPAVSVRLQPLLEILPVQMITLALAALGGREAGRFEHSAKITAIE